MKNLSKAVAICAFAVLGAIASTGAHAAEPNWPNWRGPAANGVAPEGNPPIEWSENKNIKWKVAVPGDSESTPIVWGDKIFIQTAVATEETDRKASQAPTVPYAFKVLCLDRATGKTLWEKTAIEATPHEGHHQHSSFSAYSPVTDGEKLWVSFGSRGLYCYDFDGNLIWSKELPKLSMTLSFGEASSPALAGDKIVVLADHEGESKILAFDKNTGQLVWDKARDEKSTWGTPFAIDYKGKTQIVTTGTKFIRSYDVENGDLLWQCSGLTSAAIPTPVTEGDLVFCATGYQGYAMLAIRLDSTGDVSGTDSIVWQLDRGTPYVCSPLLYEGQLYTFESVKSELSAYKASDGTPIYEKQKLEGLKSIYASPVGVADRIYVADRNGNVAVVKHGDSPEVLAINTLDEGFDASPVVIGDELYLKGERHLYCVANSR